MQRGTSSARACAARFRESLPAEALTAGMDRLTKVSASIAACVARNSEPWDQKELEAALLRCLL